MSPGRKTLFLSCSAICCVLFFRAGQTHPSPEAVQARLCQKVDEVSNLEVRSARSSASIYNTHCEKQFVQYIPGSLEQRWRSQIKVLESNDKSWASGCAALRDQLDEVHEMVLALKQYAADPTRADVSSAHLSAFHYHDSCTGQISVVHIEPLISFLRHPLALCPVHGVAHDILDKSYLHVQYQSEISTSANNFLFDAGASTYDTGAGGASQSWFVNTYRSRGIEFDRIIGWESAETAPSKQWGSVPADIKRKTSWFNIPVTTGIDDADNPLTHIKHLTTSADFVVFKLDIDSPLVEMELVRQLMSDPQLLNLVDEFYFEHHVSGSPMQWHGWGDLRFSSAPNCTLSESYEIFAFLREHGVRAHSWV